jgi:hypothetical protein
MFLCQRLPTNRTIFVPHIYTCLFANERSVRKILRGWSSPVCPDWNRSKSVPFCISTPFFDALVCSRILVRPVLLLRVRRVKSRNPGQIGRRSSCWSCPPFQDEFFASSQLAMKKRRAEARSVLERGRECVLLWRTFWRIARRCAYP